MLVSAIHQHELVIGIHTAPPSWTFLPPRTPCNISRLSQSTGFELPALYSKFPLATHFPYGKVYVLGTSASQLAPVVKNLPTNTGDKRDVVSIPGLGRSPAGGHHNPLQYSCLENTRDGEPGGLPSMGSHRVRHDWSDLAAAAAAWCRELKPSALWQPRGMGWSGRWEEGSRRRGHKYSCGWFKLTYGRNQHNIVTQLFSNLK